MNYVENLSERCVLQLMMRMNVFQRTELMNENICTLEIKKKFFFKEADINFCVINAYR